MEKVCMIMKDLANVDHTSLEPVVPAGYKIEQGWRGKETPAIWSELVQRTFGDFVQDWTAEKFTSEICSKPGQFDENGLFFATSGGQIVGSAFAWVDKPGFDKGRVHFVCVLPEHRRRGLARALTVSVVKFHRDTGKRDATLRTEDFRTGAIQLYKSIGFRECSEREIFPD